MITTPQLLTTPQSAGTSATQEIANLDALRTFAVLAVFVDHLIMSLNSLYWKDLVLDQFVRHLGRLGVIAFFVHTSFVLMLSLQRLEKDSTSPVLAFYVRRIFRIYPLSILIVLVVCWWQIPDLPFGTSLPGRYSALNIVSNLLLVHNFIGFTVTGPLWSLPFEVQMYAVLPLLYLVAKGSSAIQRLAGLIAMFSVVGIACYTLTGKLHFLAFIPCFLSGVLSYAVAIRGLVKPRWGSFAWTVTILAGLGLAAWAGTVWPKTEYLMGWLLSFLLGGTLHLFRDSTSTLWLALTKNVAKYSYGVYLLHVPAIWLVFRVMGITSMWLGPLVVMAFVAIGSVVVFHTLEDPMVNFGKTLSKRWNKPRIRALA